MNDFMNFIVNEALILIPVLYFLGMFLKVSSIPDRYIPIILLVAGEVLCFAMLGVSVETFCQGVLVASAAVFSNQLIKQFQKEN